MWNLSPPPGFQGLRDDLRLTVYFRHLPHWRQEGATYFVTFRLIDALPKAKLHELRRLRAEWAEHQELPANFRDAVEWSTLKFKNHDNLDRIIRDEEHLYSSIQYIGRNPKAAHLTTEECLRWIRPEWLSLGWSFC